MNELSLSTILAIAVPLAAAFLGWLILWRRNTVLYRIHNVHFCGMDIAKKGFWSPDKKRMPLFDALDIQFRNLGPHHLDEFSFMLYNVADDFVAHPEHTNGIPDYNFSFEHLEPEILKVTVKEVPAFERFGFSLLNTHPKRQFWAQGAGKNYRLVFVKKYKKQMAIAGILLGVLAIFSLSIFWNL